MICLLTAVGVTPGGGSTVHIYTKTIHRITQLIWEEWGPCPVLAGYTLAFALQLRKRNGISLSQDSRRVPVGAKKNNIQNITYLTIRIHKNNNKNT